LLNLAADVRAGEGTTALLLAINGFLILTSYYLVRPVRGAFLNPIVVNWFGNEIAGPELTSYSGAALAFLFLFIVPLYGGIASRVNRIKLINGVTLFFVSNLVLFYLLVAGAGSNAALAIGFYLWVGIFNLMVVAQFWSFANDLYTEEEGKRLFAILGIGGSSGAIAGAYIARSLIRELGPEAMLPLSAGVLVLCVVLTNIVHRRERARAVDEKRRKEAERPLSKEGGFQLVLASRYLLLIGLMTWAVQFVNTNGNYMLNERATAWAREANPGGASDALEAAIGGFLADMDFWQNVLVVLIQVLLVSRIFKYLGVGGALFILPTLAFVGYGLFALVPVLGIIRATKIGENATDYSLQNTVRRALFLPMSREVKYKALNAIETFFWRAGDMLSALSIFVMVGLLSLSVRATAIVSLVVVGVWLVIAVYLSRENRRLSADAGHAIAPSKRRSSQGM
jgi:AAA family ATP:ADP antiporter